MDIERVNMMRIIAVIATVAFPWRCYVRYNSSRKDGE
jgi:hypothetical protein